eukprot:gnl/TRDRNA2_/TRDRNA2_192779_c0_seq1.p1 gnl/TRDRNA2_/TRDRNA2_192779_c0~~gnl/TRDRNA2_/TRDRNA2_192779_c0_seq1.p1  ORF type:complete len:303 (+),score=22.66 gnl/TRDRNA2_/TRDRNA2_192779_c0_seq1:1-909(+)
MLRLYRHMGTLSHLEKIGVFPSSVLGDPICLVFGDESVLQNSFTSAATARADSNAAPFGIAATARADSNATPFGITQAEALTADPSATATSFGYISASYTMPLDSSEPLVPGLVYLRNFLTDAEASALQEEVDHGKWDDDNKSRRTQQFGYGFHWRNRHDNALVALSGTQASMPHASQAPLRRLVCEGYLSQDKFDQCIVNDYFGGQGIKPHLDRDFFGEEVVGFSLGSAVVMDFRCSKTSEVRALLLEPHSVLILTGDARWSWQHAITPAPTLLYRGERHARSRRTSLTFRTISNWSVVAA